MFENIVKDRFSVRDYSSKQVEKEKLDKILEAARVAPTACNNQPVRIIALQSEEALEKVHNFRMSFNAPTVLLVCFDDRISWKARDGHDAGVDDACIITTSMMYQATELGVDSLWARAFDAHEMKATFNLDEHLHVVSMLLLGYRNDGVTPADRHFQKVSIDEMVTYK